MSYFCDDFPLPRIIKTLNTKASWRMYQSRTWASCDYNILPQTTTDKCPVFCDSDLHHGYCFIKRKILALLKISWISNFNLLLLENAMSLHFQVTISRNLILMTFLLCHCEMHILFKLLWHDYFLKNIHKKTTLHGLPMKVEVWSVPCELFVWSRSCTCYCHITSMG